MDEPGSWLGGGGPSVGSRYRIDYKYGRRTNEIVFEVKAAVSGRSYVVDTVEAPYPILIGYVFEELNDGTTTELKIIMNDRSNSTSLLFCSYSLDGLPGGS